MPGRERAAGYRWEVFKRLVFETYGTRCWRGCAVMKVRGRSTMWNR